MLRRYPHETSCLSFYPVDGLRIRQGSWELYDLNRDRVEMNDLSKKYPERNSKLQAMWQTYAKRANVIPRPESKKKNKNKKK